MNDDTKDRISARALASLRSEGPSAPPPELAARAAAHALSSRRPSAFDELVQSVLALSRPAAALGCATALVLGVAHGASSTPVEESKPDAGSATSEANTSAATATSIDVVTVDDAAAWVLPISLDEKGGAQ